MIKELIKSKGLSKNFLLLFENLHHQSTISRYLVKPKGAAINILANTYFRPQDIKGFVKTDLAALEKEAQPHLKPSIILPSRFLLILNKLKKKFFKI